MGAMSGATRGHVCYCQYWRDPALDKFFFLGGGGPVPPLNPPPSGMFTFRNDLH